MRVLAVLVLAMFPAPCAAAAFPFVPPAGFTQLLPQPIDYTTSPLVYKPSTGEYVVAEAFPTVTTEAQLVNAMHAVRQQFADLPAQIGKLDQPATICKAQGVHGSYQYEYRKQRAIIEHWEFISGGKGYSIEYIRPEKLPRNDLVVAKMLHFCPGDESQMSVLNLPGFQIGGPARHYHLAGDWISRTLGGQLHELVYLYGTNLDYDPSMHASWLKRYGFTVRSSLYASHCGSPLQMDTFSFGGHEDGIITQREFSTVSDRTSVLTYTRDANLPAAPAAEKALKTFCIPRAPIVDFSGSWGGAGAEMVIAGRSAALWTNCAQGAMLMHGANLDSSDGQTFDLPGTLLTGSTEREVRYTGTVAKRRMQIRITSLTGKLLARYDLKYGSHGDVHACASR